MSKISIYNKTFSFTDSNIKLVLKQLFLAFSNINVEFSARNFTLKSYITIKALFNTKTIEFINQIEFAKIYLNNNIKTFVLYTISL